MSKKYLRQISLFHRQLKETAKHFNAVDDADRQRLLDFNQYAAKLFVLTVASGFESLITKILKRWIGRHSHSHKELVAFFETKAIARQYHTLFDWRAKHNVNQFLGLFGDRFKKKAEKQIKKLSLDQPAGAIGNFLYLGNLRNELVHNDFINFQMVDTLDDLKHKYVSAVDFIVLLESFFIPKTKKSKVS